MNSDSNIKNQQKKHPLNFLKNRHSITIPIKLYKSNLIHLYKKLFIPIKKSI